MKYFIVLLAALLTACGVRTVPLEEAKFIPQDSEIYPACSKLNLRDPAPNLIIIRDDGFLSSSVQVVYLNGEACADLGTGEQLSLRVPAGNLIIGEDFKYDIFKLSHIIQLGVTTTGKSPTIVRIGMEDNGIRYINLSAK